MTTTNERAHLLAPDGDGTCQRCGFHPERDAPQACAIRVVYIPSTHRIQDFIAPNGVTFYGRKTLEDVQREDGADAVILPIDEACELRDAAFRSPVMEITERQFMYALEVLPPCRWERGATETFHISERLTGNLVHWYAHARDRYFTLTDDATLAKRELDARVLKFIAEHPEAAPVTNWIDAQAVES